MSGIIRSKIVPSSEAAIRRFVTSSAGHRYNHHSKQFIYDNHSNIASNLQIKRSFSSQFNPISTFSVLSKNDILMASSSSNRPVTRSMTGTRPMSSVTSHSNSAPEIDVDRLEIEHDTRRNVFKIHLGSGTAKLKYRYVSPHIVELFHTEVPPEYRGRGIGAKLAQTAFAFVLEKDLHMNVSCLFLQRYLAENPRKELKERNVVSI